MIAVRHMSEVGLAVLFAAATAAADVVITADEVMHCWDVRLVGRDSVCFTLPRLELRTLSALDIYEIRLADSSRVVELAARIPEVTVALDAGQPVPAQHVRAQGTLRLRLARTRENRTKGLPSHGGIINTLPSGASPAEMAARCRDMEFVLRECGRNDEAVTGLLREVSRECDALHSTGLDLGTCCLSGTAGALSGALLGGEIGNWLRPGSPTPRYGGIGTEYDFGGAIIGCPVGCIAGFVIGATVGTSRRANELTRQHRSRINDLIRRVNGAVVASVP